MRAPLLLPISITLLSAFPALAQDAPRVLFCSGPCFAVDANGVRTPAPKGTTLRPNQRFETGPGGYAQLKLGADAAIAVADSARVRFDLTSVQDPMVVNLDLGRARMLLREGIGKPTRPIELNTADGRFLLRNADVEVKRTQLANAGNVTVMKVNAGQAQLRTGSTWTPVITTTVQGVAGGKVISQPISAAEMTLSTPSRPTPASTLPGTLALPPVAALPVPRGELPVLPSVRPLPPTVTAPLPGTIADASPRPVLSRGDLIPIQPIITPTGEIKTLTSYVLTDPALTTSTTTKSLELSSTSTTSLSSISLTTTTTSLTDTTVTTLTTSPTAVTTTTTTTTSTLTSPTITTTIQPITLSPTLITR